MGPWSVSWKSTYVRMRMAATHHKQWATSKVGMLARITASAEEERGWLRRRRIGHAVTGASNWLQMPLSTMNCPSVHTRPWAARLWTAVCITGRDSEEQWFGWVSSARAQPRRRSKQIRKHGIFLD